MQDHAVAEVGAGGFGAIHKLMDWEVSDPVTVLSGA